MFDPSARVCAGIIYFAFGFSLMFPSSIAVFGVFGTVLLMDMKILYHLGWLKHCHGILYQQARDFFYQQPEVDGSFTCLESYVGFVHAGRRES